MAPMSDSERQEFQKLLKQLERIRRDLGWPQEKIAAVCGVTQETYSRWVNDKSAPASGLVVAGLKARVPALIAELRAFQRKLIAELRADQRKIEKILRELESLRKEGEE